MAGNKTTEPTFQRTWPPPNQCAQWPWLSKHSRGHGLQPTSVLSDRGSANIPEDMASSQPVCSVTVAQQTFQRTWPPANQCAQWPWLSKHSRGHGLQPTSVLSGRGSANIPEDMASSQPVCSVAVAQQTFQRTWPPANQCAQWPWLSKHSRGHGLQPTSVLSGLGSAYIPEDMASTQPVCSVAVAQQTFQRTWPPANQCAQWL